MKTTLARFVDAQDSGDTYQRALSEITAGRKTTHWMWFVFPQLAGLGRSPTAQHYAIADLAEARAYLAHLVLGPRLEEISTALLAHRGRDIVSILGQIDALKLRSSMTLFDAAGESTTIYSEVLTAFYDGARDDRTLALLGEPPR